MTRILEKYIDIFPPILFLCSDNLHSMHFILSLKYMSDTQQEELVELMHHCGAEVTFNVKEATDHSAVIVDHDEVVSVKAPAFTIKYIEECLRKLKVQDISNYRQDATSHMANNVQCMDVVYFRKQCWDSVLTKAEKQWFNEKVDWRRSLEPFEPQAASSCVGILSSVNRSLGSSERKGESKPEEENPKTNNKCRLLSSDEDSDVEQEDNRVCLDKTQENVKNCNVEIEKSMNPKAEKSMNPKAAKDSTNSLSKSLNSKSTNGTAENSGRNQNISGRSTASSTSAQSSSKWAFLDEFQRGSSDEEDVQPKARKEKEKKTNFFDFDAANEDLFKPSKDRKHSRMPYSYDEQSNILKYIVNHCEYSRIKGRELWMIMERRKICPNRTWQSMKEHFVKKIAFNLETFDFLTTSDKMKLKQVLF